MKRSVHQNISSEILIHICYFFHKSRTSITYTYLYIHICSVIKCFFFFLFFLEKDGYFQTSQIFWTLNVLQKTRNRFGIVLILFKIQFMSVLSATRINFRMITWKPRWNLMAMFYRRVQCGLCTYTYTFIYRVSPVWFTLLSFTDQFTVDYMLAKISSECIEVKFCTVW